MIVDGIVIRGHGKSFIVRYQGRDISCNIRGKIKFRTESTTPVAVGDHVGISIGIDGSGVIEQVAERRSMFFRGAKGAELKKQVIAANLDRLAVVASVIHPDLNTRLIDRFLIAAEIGHLKPLIIINKLDLEEPKDFLLIKKGYDAIGIPLYPISAKTGQGRDALLEALKGNITILAGHSGVGKTALINCLIPGLNLKEGAVSQYTDRGIHTTSLVELFELPEGGFIGDSPGLKVMGLWEIGKRDLAAYFPEMNIYLEHCRFPGCSHIKEPDCAVKKAVESGKIPSFRYDSYVTIYNSL